MATQTRVPTGAGSSTLLTPSAGANWECVSDLSDATYVSELGTAFKLDLYAFTAFDISSTEIEKLGVTVRHQDDGTNCNYYARLLVNGTGYTGSIVSPGSSWADTTYDWLTNPKTASAWLEADIEGSGDNPLQEFGVNARGSDPKQLRISEVSATVTYTEAAPSGNPYYYYAQQ